MERGRRSELLWALDLTVARTGDEVGDALGPLGGKIPVELDPVEFDHTLRGAGRRQRGGSKAPTYDPSTVAAWSQLHVDER